MDLSIFATPEAWISLVTLMFLEIVLGVDNLVFIVLTSDRLPPEKQHIGRKLGLLGALVSRVVFLCFASFLAHTHLSRITIPNTVTQIGKEAFTNCHYLKEVSFENGCKISTIENNTFQDCDRLTKVTLPNTIVRIGDYAFDKCTVLSTINFPDNLQYIGNSAFKQTSIKNALLPTSIETIGSRAFYECTALTSVRLSPTLKYLSDYLFSCCSSLTHIDLPSTITSIGTEALNCPIDSIDLPDGLKTIGDKAFGMARFRTIVIPSTVNSIGKDAFYISSYGKYPNSTTYLDNIILESKEYLDLSNTVPVSFVCETLYPLNLIVPYHLKSEYDAMTYKLIRGTVSAYDVNAVKQIVSNKYYHLSNRSTGQYLQLSANGDNETSLISENDMHKSAGAQIRLIESGTVNKYYMITQEMTEPILVTLNYKGEGCPKEHPAFWKWNILVDGKYIAVDTKGNFVKTDVADDNADWYIASANTIDLDMLDGQDGKSYATVYYPFDVKVSTENTHIYAAEQTDEKYVYLKEIENGGILKKGNAALIINNDNSNIVSFDIVDGAFYNSNNLFKGSCKDYFNINAEDKTFVLDYRNGELGFYPPESPVIKANQAYLERDANSANAHHLMLYNDANGIHDINREPQINDGVIYDMLGRKMREIPQKGLYIINNKLHIK